MKSFLRDPLFQFFMAGFGLFMLFRVINPGDVVDGYARTIVVDRNALLEFVQYRTKAFEPDVAAARLDALSGDERRLLIAEYVREEVLHREAMALSLDRDDYVIRRRLVQKLEFVAQGFAADGGTPKENDVAAYFERHKSDYYVDPYITFTHVFFDAERHGLDETRILAGAMLGELNLNRVEFDQATKHGDRFLYHVNYVERTPAYVGGHFGSDMATALFDLEPGDRLWHGPFESSYGMHLVLVTKVEPGRYPSLDEIRGRVEQDALRKLSRERTEEAIREIIEGYEIRVALDGWDDTTVAVASH